MTVLKITKMMTLILATQVSDIICVYKRFIGKVTNTGIVANPIFAEFAYLILDQENQIAQAYQFIYYISPMDKTKPSYNLSSLPFRILTWYVIINLLINY